jgi:hypothetical protein
MKPKQNKYFYILVFLILYIVFYFFEESEITFSTSIPYGGTLVTQENKIIAMNVQHYI